MLRVSEIFHSLQGEGPFLGRPAVFLRLAGCLEPYCSFCDTPQALAGGRLMSVAETSAEISARRPASGTGQAGRPLVVITGGEPFRQWSEGLAELEEDLIGRGLEIQYESSGRAGLPAEARGRTVLSPKPGQWPPPEILARAFALKVLWTEADSPSILAAIAASGCPADRVWLMPLGASRAEQLARMPLLWDVCRLHGYRLSPRLHILAFDRQSGV